MATYRSDEPTQADVLIQHYPSLNGASHVLTLPDTISFGDVLRHPSSTTPRAYDVDTGRWAPISSAFDALNSLSFDASAQPDVFQHSWETSLALSPGARLEPDAGCHPAQLHLAVRVLYPRTDKAKVASLMYDFPETRDESATFRSLHDYLSAPALSGLLQSELQRVPMAAGAKDGVLAFAATAQLDSFVDHATGSRLPIYVQYIAALDVGSENIGEISYEGEGSNRSLRSRPSLATRFAPLPNDMRMSTGHDA